MKKLFTGLFALLLFGISNAEIVLEHTYNDGNIRRVYLENSGEKYYLLDKENNEVQIFNSDHSPWKTINLHTPEGAIVTAVYSLFENSIIPDGLIDLTYSYYVNNQGNIEYESRLINENGTIHLTVPGASSLFLSNPEGADSKLISFSSGTQQAGMIYSLPDLALEHTYNSGYVTRVILDNSGEKYYALDNLNNRVELFNSDHTPWKTIDLPAPEGATIIAVYHLSETKIIPDDQIDLTYSYYYLNEGMPEYESRVINESGQILLTVNGATSLTLSKLPGLPNKLISGITGAESSGAVYSTPDLELENFYNNGNIVRILLENSGEKYYLLDSENKQAKLFNSNHTPWKTIDLPTFPEATVSAIYHLSETKIINDDQIQLAYSYYAVNEGVLEYESRVVDESETILLTVEGASNMFLSEILGQSNKLIADIYGESPGSKVYDVPSISTSILSPVRKDVAVFPNPASNNISLSNNIMEQIDNIVIYNLDGKQVIELKYPQHSSIDISALTSGLYIITGSYKDGIIFQSKFVVN